MDKEFFSHETYEYAVSNLRYRFILAIHLIVVPNYPIVLVKMTTYIKVNT